ncbi:hypothetical protein [Planctomicrobium sp. SH664]|uniref:hypothetical protein n=1 Tax=Planctomicrobium sp. SH664 TaxID=3448125 RepID=UPI003F5C0C66
MIPASANDRSPLFHWIVWTALVALLILNVPLFLCQHLTADAVIYDLQARCASEGGILYQDLIEPNFPGAVWIHLLVRQVGGWSWVTLRAFDLLMVCAIAGFISHLARARQESFWTAKTGLIALGVFGLHFSQSEWCHCQRDLWMLLPCLAAVAVRRRQLLLSAPQRSWWSSLAEGMLWGTAFWLKPHIAFPALSVLLASAWITGLNRPALRDLAGVFCGGLLAGGIGSLWMVAHHCWEPFWEMQLEWNPEYLQSGQARKSWQRYASLWESFLPFSWLHVIAIGVVGFTLQRCLRQRSHRPVEESDALNGDLTRFEVSRILLSALYVGWMMQIVLLQHPFAYVQMPGVVLAIALTALIVWPRGLQPTGRLALVAFAGLALMMSPMLQLRRLTAWGACLREGPTLEVRSRVQYEPRPDWETLGPVLEFLKQQNLKDGELTAYQVGLVHLYPELNLKPSTRYVFLDALCRLFPSRLATIREAVEQSPQKFVVSCLREAGMSAAAIADETDPQTLLPRCFPAERLSEFPFSEPVVFRSGSYLVHRVSGPIGSLCAEYQPLATAQPATANPVAVPQPVSNDDEAAP